jgi:SAM-dependent methyltransferase
MSLSREASEILACPRCKHKLADWSCAACGLRFPVVGDAPVLLNEARSLFKLTDFTEGRETTYRKSSPLKRTLKRLIPSISVNLKAEANFQAFFTELCAANARPRVLVIGGAVAGEGFHNAPPAVELIETDVAFGPRTALICDAHDLPFKSASLDGVVAQAVLEHVLDPAQCVAEIHRVLRPGGLVYAETPFMQQVHAGRYDFTRFTHLGHRYLFRGFDEIASGPVAGPGTALAWAWCYFLSSFFRRKPLSQIAFSFGSLTTFWLKYFDHLLINRPAAYDSASCYYFLGRKSIAEISGTELIKGYKGAG